MPASEAEIGYGSKFAIESDSSPNIYTELAEIFNITPPSMTVDMIDVSHMQSPNRRREFTSGMIDPGECSFEMNYVPGSVSDNRLNELLDLAVGVERRRNCRITLPNGVTHTFAAELMTYELTVPTDDKMVANVGWKVTGAVTRTSAASPPA